jgi:hypothetical protein
MEKTRKNPKQLTRHENQLVDEILVILGMQLFKLYKTSKPAKVFAEEMFKNLRHKKDQAALYILYKMDWNPEAVTSPAEFNTMLAKNLLSIRIYSNEDDVANTENLQHKFLSPNRLSELLSILKENGIFSHIDGKSNVKKLRQFIKNEDGGMYSCYKLSSSIDQLLKLFENPKVTEKIISALTRSGILYEALKYPSAFFHYFILDADRQLLHESLNSVVKDKPEELSKTIDEIMQLKSYLTGLSDSELEQLAQKGLDLSMKSENKDIHASLYRLFVILTIIN